MTRNEEKENNKEIPNIEEPENIRMIEVEINNAYLNRKLNMILEELNKIKEKIK